MSTRHLIYVLLLAQSLHQQIVPSANLPFEKLQWGQTVDQVSKLLNRPLTESTKSIELVGQRFSRKDTSTINYSYEDTLWKQKIVVTLSFSKEKQGLAAIMVLYVGVDYTTGKALSDAEKRAELLWENFIDKFGKPEKIRSLPFLGKSSEWSYANTDVRMLSMKTRGVNMLTVYYSQKPI